MAIELPDYISAPIREKLGQVVEIVLKNIPEEEELLDYFVSTPPSEGGADNFTVWLFTTQLVVEIRNPLMQGRIQHDLCPFAGLVDWMRLDARNFEFEGPNSDSSLTLQFTTRDGLSGELWATGLGCSRLVEIYRDRFLKNFYPLGEHSLQHRI